MKIKLLIYGFFFFLGTTKSSPDDNSTGGVSRYMTKPCLFSEIKIYTDLQAVTVREDEKTTTTV